MPPSGTKIPSMTPNVINLSKGTYYAHDIKRGIIISAWRIRINKMMKSLGRSGRYDPNYSD